MVQPDPVSFDTQPCLSYRQYSSKTQYKVLEWNLNGWFTQRSPHYLQFKKDILAYLNADFLILPETHCNNPQQKIEIENYTIFQNNRLNTNNRSRGSGGIAIAVKSNLLEQHVIISIYNNSYDGQLGIKLKNIYNDFVIGIVGLYLSPNNYRYGQDAEGFFNNAAVLWQDLYNCDLLVGAGDVNARTKELLDYIPEIDGDLISRRSNPDKFKNSHGDCFLTFLKEN